MIDIVCWRVRIGLFGHPRGNSKADSHSGHTAWLVLQKTWRPQIVLIVLTLLVLCGDVETNPGPGPGLAPSNPGHGQDDGRQLRNSTQRKLTFERQPQRSPGSSQQDLGKLIRELKEELKDELKSTNGKLVTELSKLSEKLDKVIVTNDKLESNIKQLQDENQVLKAKVRNLEDQSRRDNLIVWGIEEEDDDTESWIDCEEKVRKAFKDTLGIENAEDEDRLVIERAHRLE